MFDPESIHRRPGFRMDEPAESLYAGFQGGDAASLVGGESAGEEHAARPVLDLAVELGDVGLAMGALADVPTTARSPEDWFRDLIRLAQEASRKDREGFLDEILDQSMVCLGLVLLRCQHLLLRRLQSVDRLGDEEDAFPRDVREKLLPGLVDLSRHLAELQRLKASTRRQRELVASRVIEACKKGPPDTKSSREKRRGRDADGPPKSPKQP